MKKAAKTRGKMGRPTITEAPLSQPVNVRLPGPMLEAIERIRAGRMDAPDRGSVIRELLAEAIEARAAKKS
jgi:hypothetical protein